MYDPWGKQFLVNNSILTYSSPAQSKGYTGHEMVNDFEVIHMGGRTYNPTLGRFMQADPFIQQPGNLQSYNRYAYVQNNPMSYTDPSGYFFKKLFNVIKENWRTIAAIAIAVYMPHMAFMKGFSAVQAGALTGFVSGGVATGSLRGAIIGGITGAAFGRLHDWSSKLIAKGIDFSRIAAHGMVGGISSVLSGGKFGHGFMAAGFTQAASEIGGERLFIEGDRLGNAVKAAAIGGTASVLSGGKFGNGAITGAFSRLLNDEATKPNRPKFSTEDKRLNDLVALANEHSASGHYDGLLPQSADGNISLTIDPTIKGKMSPLSNTVIGILPEMLSFSIESQVWALGHELSHIGDLYTMYQVPNKSAQMRPLERKASEIKAYNWSLSNADVFFSDFNERMHYKQVSLKQISCYRKSGESCGH